MESVDVALAVAVAVAVRESSTVGAALTDGDADILTLPLRDGLDDRARDDDTLPVGVAALVTLTGGDADIGTIHDVSTTLPSDPADSEAREDVEPAPNDATNAALTNEEPPPPPDAE